MSSQLKGYVYQHSGQTSALVGMLWWSDDMFSACQNQVVWVTNNQCEPVSHRVLGLGVKKINKEDSCICRGFVLNKPWVFLSPTFVSI